MSEHKLALKWGITFVLDRGVDGERDDGVLWDDLLPCSHRGKVSEEVHALRRHAPHRSMAQHGRLNLIYSLQFQIRLEEVAYLSSDGLKKVTCHGTECITILLEENIYK